MIYNDGYGVVLFRRVDGDFSRFFTQKSAIFRTEIGPILVPDFLLKNRRCKKIAISRRLAIYRAIFVTEIYTNFTHILGSRLAKIF